VGEGGEEGRAGGEAVVGDRRRGEVKVNGGGRTVEGRAVK